MFLSLNNVKKIELAPKPTLNTARYNENKGTIEISGTIASPVTVEIYQADTFSTTEEKYKLIKTEKITSPGNFNLSIAATTGVIYTRFVKEATDKIYYWNESARTSPGFKIEDDKTISTSTYTPVISSGQVKTNKASERATIKTLSYDKDNKELTISGITEAGALISICNGSYSSNETYGEIYADENGNFKDTVLVSGNSISIYTLYKSTDSIIYSTSLYPSIINISDSGRLVVPNDVYNEDFSTPLPSEKRSAIPDLEEMSYDENTKMFHVSGSLPADTSISISQLNHSYGQIQKTNQYTTNEAGNFNISLPIETNNIRITISQKSTADYEYLTIFGDFDIISNGKIRTNHHQRNWVKNLGVQIYDTTDVNMEATPTPDVDHNIISFPIQVAGIANIQVYNNNSLVTEQKTDASGFINLPIPIRSGEDNVINIVIQQEETSKIFYRDISGYFRYDKTGVLSATSYTNYLFKTTFPISPTFSRSTPPRFDEITYDEEKKLLNIYGKINQKGQVSAYINKIKTISVNTSDDGKFTIDIPINSLENGTQNISIGATFDSSNENTYTSSWISFDSPMFTVDASKGLQICGEAEPLIDLKKLITPIPKIEPFTVGDGIIIEGTTLPFSEILIKKNGIEYKGTADDKGIFKIPLNEVTLSDVLEIIAKAPDGTTSSYDASESSSMSPAKTVSEAECEAIESQLENMIENDINHIMLEHHDWEKVIDSVSWENVKPLIKEVMEKGITSPYGKNPEFGVLIREAKIGTETMGVTFRVIDGIPIISDAWINK